MGICPTTLIYRTENEVRGGKMFSLNKFWWRKIR